MTREQEILLKMAKKALSADAVCEDTQTEKRARFIAKETELAHIEAKLENAEKRLQGACTANFVAEQLDRLRNMTDEERLDFLIRFFSPSAEQVTSKLNNPCDSLLTDDSAECKKQKSKLESADAVCEDTQTEERARFVAKETELAHIEARLENAEKRLQGACVANFVVEQLERLREMTDEEKWEFFKRFFEMKGGAE